MPTLENDVVRLRALEPADIDLLYDWENDTDTWRVSSTIAPISRSKLTSYIKHASFDIYQTKQMHLMIEAKGELLQPVGLADIFNFDPFHLRAEVGLLIANQSDRQKGYASNALMLLIDYTLGHLGLHQLYCNVANDNEPCLALFTKHGFTIAGVKKEWRRTTNGWSDEVMLQRVKAG